MQKRWQNRVAESNFTLPLMTLYGIGVWVASGLVAHHWWGQLACFAVSVYLMIELSNSNALLRVRSRMVSSTFIALSCLLCGQFGSLSGGIVQLCMVAAIIILFRTYQHRQLPGLVYYAFLCIGLGTTVFARLFYFVPVLWLLMATQLQSLGWRSWLASLLGLATPYWFGSLWFIYQQDFAPLGDHFAQLAQVATGSDYLSALLSLSIGQSAAFVLTMVLTLMGMMHFWYMSFEDKIRIRLLYGFFAVLCLLSALFLLLQPQHYDVLMRLVIVSGSPFVAHYFTLTHSRFTNIMFCVALVLTLVLMLFNLLTMLVEPLSYLNPTWSGLLIS